MKLLIAGIAVAGLGVILLMRRPAASVRHAEFESVEEATPSVPALASLEAPLRKEPASVPTALRASPISLKRPSIVLDRPIEFTLSPEWRVSVVFHARKNASRVTPNTVWEGRVVGVDASLATLVEGPSVWIGWLRIPGKPVVELTAMSDGVVSVREIDERSGGPCGTTP